VDDAGVAKSALVESGYGLKGIRERAELLGGRLEAGPTPGGYRLKLRMPRMDGTEAT